MRLHAIFAVFVLCISSAVAVKTITIASDGSGDFKSVQEIVVTAPESSAVRTEIHIKPGTYKGQIIA
jgi:pectin methylesterase-like acyl-CoA thioesterase